MDGGLPGILGLLSLGLLIVLAFQRLGASALVAYIIAGAIAGPAALGLVTRDQLGPLAEIGAALLLFSIGLELDLGAARRRLAAISIASGVQIGLTLVAGSVLAMLAGLDLAHAVAVGACLTMTSTIVLLRSLEERSLRYRPEGELALGVSLMQDICLGPFLILLALLLPVSGHAPPATMLLGMLGLAAGTWVLRRATASRLYARIRAAKMPELETIFGLTIALGAAAATEHIGLGGALGAFAAGLALGGGEHRHAVESNLRPLLGVTAVLFFASMGALFDARFVLANWWQIAALVLASGVLKAGIAAFGLRLAGLPPRSALGTGLLLAQIGEFSFVLATAAFADADDPTIRHLFNLIVATTCISLALAPLLAAFASRLLPRPGIARDARVGDTIVVAGLGPVGNSVVETLRNEGHRLLLVDRNERLLAPWEGVAGVEIHRGRIEQIDDWLPRLGQRPPLVVLTFPIADTSALVARRLREFDPRLVVLARAPFRAQIDVLRSAGVQFVICDEEETTRSLLPLLNEALRAAPPSSTRPTVMLTRQ